MTRAGIVSLLEAHDIQPSAQRVAVAEFVLHTSVHPSADEVWVAVRKSFPMISRATAYNTLNLFVEKALLQELHISEGKVVFDPNLGRHHHFIDETTGMIHDIPWDQVQVSNIENLKGFNVRDFQVLIRGTLKSRRRS